MDNYELNVKKFYEVNSKDFEKLEQECKFFCEILGIVIKKSEDFCYTKMLCNFISKSGKITLSDCGVFSSVLIKSFKKLYIDSFKDNFSFKKFIQGVHVEIRKNIKTEFNTSEFLSFIVMLIKIYLSFFYKTEKEVDNLFNKIIDIETEKVFIFSVFEDKDFFLRIFEELNSLDTNYVDNKLYFIEKIYNKYVEIFGESNDKISKKIKLIKDKYSKISQIYVADNILYLYEEYNATVFDWNIILKGLIYY